MNTPTPTPVRAHYYIYGIPQVIACATVTEALFFWRQAYGDPNLGAIALEILFTAADLGRSSWKDAFDCVLAGHGQYRSRPIEPPLYPKCVIAGYRTNTFRINKAFPTLTDALEFLDLGAGQELEMARLRVHLTAADVWQIVPVTLYSNQLQAWDFAVDSVLHGRVSTSYSTPALQRNAA